MLHHASWFVQGTDSNNRIDQSTKLHLLDRKDENLRSMHPVSWSRESSIFLFHQTRCIISYSALMDWMLHKRFYIINRKIATILSAPVAILNKDRNLSNVSKILYHKSSSLKVEMHVTVRVSKWLIAPAETQSPMNIVASRNRLQNTERLKTEKLTNTMPFAAGRHEVREHTPFTIVITNFSMACNALQQYANCGGHWGSRNKNCMRRIGASSETKHHRYVYTEETLLVKVFCGLSEVD